jgi:transcriptional regulator with XRE-family HTH domain
MGYTKKDEIERIIRLLRTAMRLLGFTNREIERRLEYTPSYLTRLFSGQIELRFEHVVDIVHAMEMTVEEFFRFAYPEREQKPSEASVRLDAMLEEMRPTPPPPENPRLWREEELERTVVGALQKVVADEREQQHQQRKDLLDLLKKVDLLQKEYRDIARDLRREEPKLRPKPAKRPGAKKKATA